MKALSALLVLASCPRSAMSAIRNNIGQCVVSTVAGNGRGNQDGTGVAARFNLPMALALTPSASSVLVADAANHNVRIFDVASTNVTTMMSLGAPGPRISGPGTIAVDPSTGHVYIADDTTVSILLPLFGMNATQIAGGVNSPQGLAVDGLGNVYIADTGSNCIRVIRAPVAAGSATPAVFSGSCNQTVDPNGGGSGALAGQGAVDGSASAARFNAPFALAIDGARGLLYVTDSGNNAVRAVRLADGSVATLAGNLSAAALGLSPPAGLGADDGTGAAARFNSPTGLAVDPSTGNLFVADMANNALRLVTPAGATFTLAGSANSTTGTADGPGAAARFFLPLGVALSAGAATVYVADADNHALRALVCPGVLSPPGGNSGGGGHGPMGPIILGPLSLGAVILIAAGILVVGAGGSYGAFRLVRARSAAAGGAVQRLDGPASPYPADGQSQAAIKEWRRSGSQMVPPSAGSPSSPHVALSPLVSSGYSVQ